MFPFIDEEEPAVINPTTLTGRCPIIVPSGEDEFRCSNSAGSKTALGYSICDECYESLMV